MTRARECEGKRTHRTKAIAKDALWTIVRYRGGKPGQMSAYHCKFCGFWHIGHTRHYKQFRKR